jgi:DNA-binding transcriptional ArsR family regulator
LTINSAAKDVDLRALAQSQASLCGVFANAKRVLILWSLLEEEKSVSEIAAEIEASLQCTSQHLHLMKSMGILDSRRDGQMIYYAIVREGLVERCQLLLEAYRGRWPAEGLDPAN